MLILRLLLGSLSLSLLLAQPAASQRPAQTNGGVVRGTVRAERDAPVEAASVALRRSADTTLVGAGTTDSTGAFRVVGVGPGSYRLEVRRLGFRMATRGGITVGRAMDAVDLGVIRLEAATLTLAKVAVTAARPAVSVLPDRNVYSTSAMPVAAGGMATDVLRSVPELEVSIAGRVTAGGAQPQIHINGRPAPMQGEALDRYLQQLPAERIERVEVIANPSARYAADGQGGIVNIVMKRGIGLGVSGSAALSAGTRNQQGGSGNINYQKDRWSLFGSASASFFGNISRSSDLRQNLNAEPITYIQLDTRNRNSGGMISANLGAELQVGSGGTLWTELGIGRNRSGAEAFTTYIHLDHLRTSTQRYDRVNEGALRGLLGSSALGYRNADEDGRHTWSLELRRNFNGGHNSNESARYGVNASGAALDLPPEMTFAGDAQDQNDLSAEANLLRAWGKSGQVEAGYRGSQRNTGSTFRLEIDAPSNPPEADEQVGEFRNGETIHAAFVTASQRIGRFSVQAGVRGEQAEIRTFLPRENETFEARYRRVFPSANVSTSVGAAVQLRLSYSERVERPEASILNPSTPMLDPLNLQTGNPFLLPEYTHSLSFSATRTGRMGMLQFSPYYRRTVNSWDQVRTVDEAGVSTMTWQNLATITSYGGRVSASVRQLGPLSGLVSVSGHREVRDASNLREDFSGSAMRYSASSTFSLRATSALNLQGSLAYLPARQVPQGKMSPIVFSTLGARLRLRSGRAAVSFSVIDPLELQRFTFTTRDRSHVQTGSSILSARRATMGISYSFGRPPESKRRAGSTNAAEQDDRSGRRIR